MLEDSSIGYTQNLEAFFEGLSTEFTVNSLKYSDELSKLFDEMLFRINLFLQFKHQADRYLSSDFNVFDVIAPDENKLSDILANILDYHGSHGQGPDFLNEFLRFLSGKGLPVPLENYSIHREVSANGRIDLLLDSQSFAIIIENKPFTQDQLDQLNRYYEAMSQKRGENVAVVYLNKNKQFPQYFSSEQKKQQLISLSSDNKFKVISYLELKDYLMQCYQKCHSNKFRYFLDDFIRYVHNTFRIYQGEENGSIE
jgi:hypothetical protein